MNCYEHDLETALKNREPGAFEEIMDKYSKLLWVIVAGIIRDIAAQQDVEDCVADVFLHLWQHPEKYDCKKGDLKTYLAMVARNKAIDKYRKLCKQTTVLLEEDISIEDNDFFEVIEQQEKVSELYDALSKLNEPDKEIMIRRFFYEEKPADTAKKMSLPLKEIGNRIYRSKQRLKEMLLNNEKRYEV